MKSNVRRKISSEFKTKVYLEVLKKRYTIEVVYKNKHNIHPTQKSLNYHTAKQWYKNAA